MTAEIKGNNLVITLPFDEKGKPSASGKNINHASTGGNKETNVELNGKKLIIGVNAYTSNK